MVLDLRTAIKRVIPVYPSISQYIPGGGMVPVMYTHHPLAFHGATRASSKELAALGILSGGHWQSRALATSIGRNAQ